MATPPMVNLAALSASYVNEHPEAAPRPASGPSVSNLACPHCLQNGVETPLMSAFGKFGYFCRNNHTITDTEELMASNPKRLENVATEVPAKKPNPSDTPITVTISPKAQAALQARFGSSLMETLHSLLETFSHPNSFVVPGEDANQMGQYLSVPQGQKVSDSQKLLGLLYELRQDRDTVKGELATLRKAGGNAAAASDAAVTVDLGTSYMEKLAEKAKFNDVPVQKLVKDVLMFGIDQGWF